MTLIRANASNIPLADDSVDLIVTSPPYFSLRSYTDGGEHYDGQIGSEPTPQEFLEALWAVTAECRRVLKPSGSMFVNLGDKYSGAQAQNTTARNGDDAAKTWRQTDPKRTGIPAKSLMGLPWRYAIGCIDQLDLILRAEIIWSKPNGLPESVTDRVRRSHEQWFHFTKEPRYFTAVDEIREDYAPASLASYARGGLAASVGDASHPSKANGQRQRNDGGEADWTGNPLGKLPGSVWTIPTEPLRLPDHLPQHFAAFPSEWPRRLILGWSPSGICVECGQGRRPVPTSVGLDESRPQARRALALAAEHGLTDAHIAAVRAVGVSDTGRGAATQDGTGNNAPEVYALAAEARKALGGYAREFLLQRPTSFGYACDCPTPDAPTRPARVLDPFCGTGTTIAVAQALGRHGIGIDLSADYLRVAEWRCRDPKLRAKVLRVDPPKPEAEGQLNLLESA